MQDTHVPTSILKKKKADAAQEAFKQVQKQRSPLQMLTDDATKLSNPWYLPHELEMAHMFDHMGTAAQLAAMRKVLGVVFRVHDILMVLCSHARLGSSHARLGTLDAAFIGVGADWGGTEGITAELRQLRRNIRFLADPTDPEAVIHFLEQRRQNVFLEWELTTKYYVPETFLSKGNQRAYDTVFKNGRSGMAPLGSLHVTAYSGRVDVARLPEAVSGVTQSHVAAALFPWRSMVATEGPYLGSFFFQNVGSYLELCLSGLDDIERHIANGEVLGISLLMEDIIEQEADDDSLEEDPTRRYELTRQFLLNSIRMEQLR
jgi:hypothetical protein